MIVIKATLTFFWLYLYGISFSNFLLLTIWSECLADNLWLGHTFLYTLIISVFNWSAYMVYIQYVWIRTTIVWFTFLFVSFAVFLVVFCFFCFLFPSYFGLFGCFWYPFYYDTIFLYSLYMGRGGLVALGTAIFFVYLKPVFSHLKWNIEILLSYSSPLYMIVMVYIMYIYVKKPLPDNEKLFYNFFIIQFLLAALK